MVQRLELVPIEAEGARKVVASLLELVSATEQRTGEESRLAREACGSSIKGELVRLFTKLPDPQRGNGVCVELGYDIEFSKRHFEKGPFVKPSVVMYPDGLYYVPMKSVKDEYAKPQACYFARYPVPGADYVDLGQRALQEIGENMVEAQPVKYYYDPRVAPKVFRYVDIFLPIDEVVELTDPTRKTQLGAKLAEYRERLEGAKAGDPGHLARVQILEALLRDGKVAFSQFESADWHRRDGTYFAFDNAWMLIKDYAETGGRNVIKGTGTGLPEVTQVIHNWPVLPPAK